MSAVRIALQALFSLLLRPLPLYRWPLRRPGPHCLSPSHLCARSRGEKGREPRVALWLGAGLSQLIPPLPGGGGGENQLRFPLPSLHLCLLALLPCLVHLDCWCVTVSHTHAAQGDCVGNTSALAHPVPRGLAQERLAVSDTKTAHARWVLE